MGFFEKNKKFFKKTKLFNFPCVLMGEGGKPEKEKTMKKIITLLLVAVLGVCLSTSKIHAEGGEDGEDFVFVLSIVTIDDYTEKQNKTEEAAPATPVTPTETVVETRPVVQTPTSEKKTQSEDDAEFLKFLEENNINPENLGVSKVANSSTNTNQNSGNNKKADETPATNSSNSTADFLKEIGITPENEGISKVHTFTDVNKDTQKQAAEKAAAEAEEKKAAEEAAKKAIDEAVNKATTNNNTESKSEIDNKLNNNTLIEVEEKEKVPTGNHKPASITLEEAYKVSSPGRKGYQLSTLDIYDGVHSYKNYTGVDESYDTSEIEKLVYEKLNTYRESLGARTLKEINTGSSEWAEIMGTTGLYEHANLTGEYGFKHKLGFFEEYKGGSENIAVVGMSSRATAEQIAERISQAWNNSPGHHGNRISKDHVAYDIAVVRTKNNVFWCVERFLIPGKAYDPTKY